MEKELANLLLNNGISAAFFLAVCFAIYKWAPPAFKYMTDMAERMTSELARSNEILRSTNELMEKHVAIFEGTERLWSEMRERLDRFYCPHSQSPNAPAFVKTNNQHSPLA
ncbi:hypothetical protein UFOVP315_13 [uncultured Caudovirales phage]|uniref:Uncharacterized protein n=1 Tax=uncultured Caudovirales phage TaxID=2100421 RepID=A0A6J5LV35_9CAUD|nr:hypothetical protein UFOVP315_13 [uncultured Caudovirales phage]